MGIFRKELFRELGQANQALREEILLFETRKQAEENLRYATWNFSKALSELNLINAKQNLEPVDIEDVLLHHCVSQATLNQQHANHQKYLSNEPQATEQTK